MRGKAFALMGCVLIALAISVALTGCQPQQEPQIPIMRQADAPADVLGSVAPAADWFEQSNTSPPRFWNGGPWRRWLYRNFGPLPTGCDGGRC
jgi:hypothetical protein